MSDTFNTTPANWQGIDDEPVAGSDNLVKSRGVFNEVQNTIKQKDDDSSSDLNFSDKFGNVVLQLKEGHIRTQCFNSKDINKYELAKTSIDDSSSTLNICDEQGYSILQLKEGHVKTKKFDSRDYSTKPKYLYKLDENATDILLGGFSNNNGVLYSNGHYGIANSAILNKEYAISTKYIVIDFSLEEHAIAYFHTVAGIDGNARLGSTMVSIDFDNKKLRFHAPSTGGTITSVYQETTISSLVSGEKYRICISKNNWNITAKIYDLKSFEVVANLTYQCYDWHTTNDGVGYMYDKFSFFSEAANITIYNIIVSTPKIDSCELMIYGDSITEGLYATTESNSYGMLVCQHFDINKVLVSGRASGTIRGVLNRIRSEVAVIKPKYVSVMIGTNGGDTVDNIVELGNLIISFGAIPIINTIIGNRTSVQTSTNNTIRTAIQILRNAGNNVLSVRLDDATALNKDTSQGTDPSYFTDKEGGHPNDSGHQAMANQFYIDIPEIFNW